tara:strand:+ start:48 stop:1364 length:1317 start_codon:yes stop_codon:yes gene_type:complete
MTVVLKYFVLMCCVLSIAGCNIIAPDLQRIYQSSVDSDVPPVILIHGAFGARLCDAFGTEKWPGPISTLLFGSYADLALTDDVPLYVCGITDRVAGFDYYGTIEDTLLTAGGYHFSQVGDAAVANKRHYYRFEYDWREDLQHTAAKLDQFVEQIRLDHADPKLRVDIVAHSMGGLITRYWLRYGQQDVLNSNEFAINNSGLNKTRKVILLGTPNFGSVSALQQLLTGAPVGFNHIPAEVLQTFPSSYQLLPHPLRNAVVGGKGQVLHRDIFDIDVWQALQWGPFSLDKESTQSDNIALVTTDDLYKQLERARRFVWSLSVKNDNPMEQLIVFGGDCHQTPARILIEDIDNESFVRLWPKEIKAPLKNIDYEALMLEPGDGAVSKQSLLAKTALDPLQPRHQYSYFPLQYAVMICEQHSRLPGNITFQDNLLHILLTKD